jgi:hypothetical protein
METQTEGRRQAHALLDRLSNDQLDAVRHVMEVLVAPLESALASAPVGAEDISEAAASAIDRARTSIKRGRGIAHDDVLKEFGLKH